MCFIISTLTVTDKDIRFWAWRFFFDSAHNVLAIQKAPIEFFKIDL